MTRPLPAGARTDPACPPEEFLDQLQLLLDRQLALAREDRFDEMTAAAVEVDELLAGRDNLAYTFTADQARRFSDLGKLHRKIGLVLAQRLRDVADQLLHSGRGKRAVRAYGT